MQVNRPSLIYSTHGKQGAIRPSTRLTQDEMTLSGVANQHLVGSGGTVNLGQAELAVADRDGSVSFRACRWTRFRLSWLALKPSPRCRALSRLCACAANVALPREHVGACGTGSAGSFGARRGSGNTASPIQCSSIRTLADIGP